MTTTKQQILRKISAMEEKINNCLQVMVFDSEEQYQAYTGPAPEIAIIDDIPRRER